MYLIQIGIIVMMILGLAGSLVMMCKDLGDKQNVNAFMDLVIGVAIVAVGVWLIHEAHGC